MDSVTCRRDALLSQRPALFEDPAAEAATASCSARVVLKERVCVRVRYLGTVVYVYVRSAARCRRAGPIWPGGRPAFGTYYRSPPLVRAEHARPYLLSAYCSVESICKAPSRSRLHDPAAQRAPLVGARLSSTSEAMVIIVFDRVLAPDLRQQHAHVQMPCRVTSVSASEPVEEIRVASESLQRPPGSTRSRRAWSAPREHSPRPGKQWRLAIANPWNGDLDPINPSGRFGPACGCRATYRREPWFSIKPCRLLPDPSSCSASRRNSYPDRPHPPGAVDIAPVDPRARRTQPFAGFHVMDLPG